MSHTHTSASADTLQRGVSWQDCPVTWQQGSDGTVGVGEIVPPKLPTLGGLAALVDAISSAGLFESIGYRAVNDVYVRLSQTRKIVVPEAVVEMWYMQGSSLKHVQGEGQTYREAYQRAQRIQRQVANFGSVMAAVQHGRAEASKPKQIKATSNELVIA